MISLLARLCMQSLRIADVWVCSEQYLVCLDRSGRIWLERSAEATSVRMMLGRSTGNAELIRTISVLWKGDIWLGPHSLKIADWLLRRGRSYSTVYTI